MSESEEAEVEPSEIGKQEVEPRYDEEFDVVVVGAGLAGTAAALTMAEEDLDVLMLERGSTPGAKNVFGGVLYTPRIDDLVGIEDAPVQRYVAEKKLGLLTDHDEVAYSFKPGSWHEEPHNHSYTVLRGDFDEWFAEQAEEAGVTLVTETTVQGLRRDPDGTVSGVETDRPEGRISAPIVVLAEGANSLVSEREDLKDEPDRETMAVAAKEVLDLPKEKIEDRFQLLEGAGAAHQYFGKGAVGEGFGGGFVYTNKRTVSVGVAYRTEDAASTEETPEEVLNAFKSHPAIAPLVADARTEEYSAKMIPEGGDEAVPDLVHDGAVLVGDTAALVFNNGVHLEGTNMAVESGYQAGKAVAEALEAGERSAEALSSYRESLEDSYVMKNLEHYSWFHDTVAEDREFVFEELPEALVEAQEEYFRVDDAPKAEHVSDAKQRMKQAFGGWLGLLKFAWRYRKMIR